ncbi:MAG: YncE family protein [Gemmatimonadaceae bacterium]
MRRPVLRAVLLLAAFELAACRDSSGPDGPPLTHPALGEVSAALALSGRPHGVAASESGVFYISQIDGNSVTRGTVDSTSQAFSGSVDVGLTPAHVALDAAATTAYTADQSGNTVSVIDVATNTMVGSIALTDGGFNLAVLPNGSRLYATTASGTLHTIDTRGLAVIGTTDVGGGANGLTFHEASSTLYVSSIQESRITEIDTRTNAIIRTYGVSDGPQRIAVSTDGSALYIASQSVGLEILDLNTGRRAPVVGVDPGAVGLALSPDGEQVYVTNPPKGLVHIVDVASRLVVKVLSGLASPRNVAFAAWGTTAIVTGEGNEVYFIR